MRLLKILLVVVAAIVSACLLFVGAMEALKSGFLRFLEDKNPEHYSQFARACDVLLKQNTNELVQISGPSDLLPKIIRDLKPSKTTITSNRVHIMVGVSRDGYAVVWEQSEAQTNAWTLSAIGDGLERIAYTEMRKQQ